MKTLNKKTEKEISCQEYGKRAKRTPSLTPEESARVKAMIKELNGTTTKDGMVVIISKRLGKQVNEAQIRYILKKNDISIINIQHSKQKQDEIKALKGMEIQVIDHPHKAKLLANRWNSCLIIG